MIYRRHEVSQYATYRIIFQIVNYDKILTYSMGYVLISLSTRV